MSASGASAPAAAANARGDLAVAWVRRRPAGPVVEIRVRPRGATAWSGRLVIDPRARAIRGPRLALAPDGRVLASWLTRPRGGPGGRYAVDAAIAAPNLAHFATERLAPAELRVRDPSPPAVLMTPAGRAMVAWAAPVRHPEDPALTAGRVRVAHAAAGRPWRDAPPIPAPAVSTNCVTHVAPGLAVRRGGGLLAWWDCHDDIRDFVVVAALGDARARFSRPRATGAVSRAPTGATLVPLAGGRMAGAFDEFDDDDRGGHLRTIARSATGRWTTGRVPLAPPAEPEFGAPFIDGAPAFAAVGGHQVALWEARGSDTLTRAWAAVGAGGALGDAAPLGSEVRRVAIAGVALAADGAAVGAWVETVAGGGRMTVARRAAGAAGFGAPERLSDATRLAGPPRLASAGAQGVLVWSSGPAGRARVRAAAVRLR